MPRFSRSSARKLATCEKPLQFLFNDVVGVYDCTIVDGRRGKKRQDLYYNSSPPRSKVRWPHGKHNAIPPSKSRAVDVVPYIAGSGAVWDLRQCTHFGGYVQARADVLGIGIRWGGDWNGNRDINDQNFHDLAHFELAD